MTHAMQSEVKSNHANSSCFFDSVEAARQGQHKRCSNRGELQLAQIHLHGNKHQPPSLHNHEPIPRTTQPLFQLVEATAELRDTVAQLPDTCMGVEFLVSKNLVIKHNA